MSLIPIRRVSLRPERAIPAIVQLFGFLAMLALFYIGLPLAIGHMGDRALSAVVPAAVALVALAVWAKRWQRKPPTRTTAEIVEADPKSSEWASRVLDKKRPV